MLNSDSNIRKYLFLVGFHAALGFLFFIIPFFSKLYCLFILVYGAYYIIKNKNRNDEALYAAAYIVGAEVIMRMTGGNLVYEIGKYGVMIFIIIGMFYKGFSKNAVAYWFYLVLLIPGIVIAITDLDFDENLRKSIAFNMSGPFALGITALYTYQRKVTMEQIGTILLLIGLPIFSCCIYLFLYAPDVQSIVTSTGSNFATSGGFGPNQVATVLGFGVFVFLSRMLFFSPSTIFLVLNAVIAMLLGYRGLVTFSRGGMITGIVILAVLLLFTYFQINNRGKSKLLFLSVIAVLASVLMFAYSSLQTGGLIENRYTNKDLRGRVKESTLSGREDIMQSEINFFLERPFLGIGVAMGAKLRNDETGIIVVSHNEITRMLAEHGSLGIIALLILLFTPMILYLDNTHNVYVFCFLAFWLLTINHAAMRLAAPSFIYALALLKVTRPNETPPLHRK